MLRTGKTVPYREKAQVHQAIAHLKSNHDLTYLLIFKMALITGLRISDVLSLRYDKNIKDSFVVLVESKSQKQAEARAKLRVYARAKETLARICEDKNELVEIMFTKPKDIYSLLPDSLKIQIDNEVSRELAGLKPKRRYCKIPPEMVLELKERHKKHKAHDCGFVFATTTLQTNRGRRTRQTISRKIVWEVFSNIGEACGFDFNTSCHGNRKTFAVMLYESTGNNSALVVKTVGWQDDKLLQTYLDLDENESHEAVEMMQRGLLKCD